MDSYEWYSLPQSNVSIRFRHRWPKSGKSQLNGDCHKDENGHRYSAQVEENDCLSQRRLDSKENPTPTPDARIRTRRDDIRATFDWQHHPRDAPSVRTALCLIFIVWLQIDSALPPTCTMSGLNYRSRRQYQRFGSRLVTFLRQQLV